MEDHCGVVVLGYDKAISPTNNCQLWLSAYEQPKIKSVNISACLGEGLVRLHP